MNPLKKNISPDKEITSLVLAHPQTLLFLEHFDIYPPFNEKTAAQICDEYNIRWGLFAMLYELYIGVELPQSDDFLLSDLFVIIPYLKNSHRYYISDIYPRIQTSIEYFNQSNDTPEIKMVGKFFHNYFHEVEEHLKYENETVFPYIEILLQKLNTDEDISKPFRLQYSMHEYKEHHNDIEEKLDDLMYLLIKYLPQKNDYQIRRCLFTQLHELDDDLRIHSLIEDLIVIPLVEKLEIEIKKVK
ncbi:MAG: hypothetical protein ACK5L7_04190 [Paludibacteraceae bacterium]